MNTRDNSVVHVVARRFVLSQIKNIASTHAYRLPRLPRRADEHGEGFSPLLLLLKVYQLAQLRSILLVYCTKYSFVVLNFDSLSLHIYIHTEVAKVQTFLSRTSK